MSRDVYTNALSAVSVRLYCAAYYHNNGYRGEAMDSGIHLRLYDANGTNYATYTYWLACWFESNNTRAAPDAYTKVINGQPAMNSWLSFSRDPNADWNINWSRCDKVRFELYVYGTAAAGDQVTMYYDDLTCSDSSGAVTAYSFDTRNGNLLSTTDPLGRTTGYAYDLLGRRISTTNPDGTSSSVGYVGQLNKATSLDELGRKSISYYDELGRLQKVDRYGTSSAVYSSVSYTYNWLDKVQTCTDELGRVTRCTYDYLGRNTVTQYFDGTVAAANVSENFESGTGWTARTYASTAPTWLAAQYSTARSYSPTRSLLVSFTANAPLSYDTGGALLYKDYAASKVTAVSFRYNFAAYGHDNSSWDDMDAGLRLRLYDANGDNYASYTYWLACWHGASDTKAVPDASTVRINGRPALNTWTAFAARDPGTDFSIDWSRCDRVRFEFYAAATGAYGDKLQMYMDDLAVTATYNGNVRDRTIYDDRNAVVTHVDGNGNKVASLFDILGRLNATREYYSATAFYQTRMSYDAVGELKTVRQENGDVTRMSYDQLGRQTSISYPDGRSETWTYDNSGRSLTFTDRSGAPTVTAYDTCGRTVRVIGSDERVVTCYNAAGQVVRESNTLGSISYQYNNNGLVSGVTEVIAGASYALSYAYNAAGQVTTVTYPDAKILTYVYDNQGRASQVKLGATSLLAFTYNLDDSVAKKSECNDNSTVAYTYNFRSWVSTIKAKDKAGAVFLDMTYTYDAVGNVKSIANAAGAAGTETYTYDRLDRLTKAVGAWGTYQYGYNAVGDRIWANEGVNRTYAYGRYSNLTSDGVYHYDYDRNGNVIWKNDTALTTRYNYLYNSFGQMTQAVKWTRSGSAWSSSIMANYSYDAAGARARTVEGNATTDFVYAGHDALLQVGADGKYVKYVYAGGLQLRVVAVGETYSYIADALGSTRFVLKNGNKDAANIMFSALTYRPFGGAVTVYSADRITFAGEAQDSTGLVYLSARYYDPAIGRFYALDPELGRLGMPQTLDRYVYCVNNPLRYTDPSGMFIPLLFIGAIIASSLFFGGANAAIAYASGGDVGSAFAGGLVEGALLPTPFAPVAGIAGAATQFYLDDGSFSESDLAFMGLAAIPIPSIGRAGKALFSEGGDAAARSLAKSRLEQALPEGYERAAELLHRSGKYDGLAGRSAQVRHSILGNYMHDAMGEIAERDGISKYTRRGLGGADFHGDGYWLDLSTKYTWPKSLQRQNAYNALYRGSGDVIFYDPQEVLRCYERIYMG